jgi:hypothetical protein
MEKTELGKEITELFDGILKLCDTKTFPAIKAALLLVRDHVVANEAIANLEKNPKE